jgi:hypothetical protein
VQHPVERLLSQPGIVEGDVETGDRTAVHLLMYAVAAVPADDRCLVAICIGVGGRAAERLGPVGRQPFGVVGRGSTVERVAHDMVGHHPLMPRFGQPPQALHTARRIEQCPHEVSMADSR